MPTPSETLLSATPTQIPPTPTPIPLAARVNELEITLANFQAELARFREALTESRSTQETSPESFVLNELIDQALLAQGAQQAGYTLTESDLQQKIISLAEAKGGETLFEEWLQSIGYTPESFGQALALSVEAAWMRDQIISGVLQSAEQVNARQILLFNADQAREVQVQLENGKDFATLATEYDPVTGGDLGWFPRGYLTDQNLEETAFNLQPGEFSQVIETPIGFHFIQVIERDPQRPIGPGARSILQKRALQDWLQTSREQSKIEILIPLE